jgi:PEP-CTERM motif
MKTIVRKSWLPTVLAAGALVACADAASAAPATIGVDHCSWDRPGVHPFMGDVVAAVDRYRDIPPAVRERLKARMARREYDDLVSIRRDSIQGRGGYDYGSTISEMHFGTHQVCRSVTRAAWSPTMEERGLVYCESGACILVPTVCRNVSRVTRQGVGNQLAEGPLVFDPPGAGPQVPAAANDPPPIDGAGPTGVGAPGAGPAGVGPGAEGAGGMLDTGARGAGYIGYPGGVVLAPPRAPGTGGSPAGGFDTPGAPPPAVPEPETWALMLAGVALLAGVARRRVSRRAAASGSGR